MEKLIAFHGDPEIKAKYLARVERHRRADEIAKGFYWNGGRGCAVGCTVHSSDHSAYESELGIPEWLAILEDSVFEGVEIEQAREWPGKFLAAIPVGADLNAVWNPLMEWMIGYWIGKLPEGSEYQELRDLMTRTQSLHRRVINGDEPTAEEWQVAWAAWAAWAARDAWDARAARDAWAAWAAWDARAAWDAWAAWDACWSDLAEKLLELLAAAPVAELEQA